MRARRRIVTALAFLAVSAGAAVAQTKGDTEKAIRAADAAWLKAYAEKDVDKATAALDEQGSMLPPSAPIASGRDAVRKIIASAFATPGYSLVWHIDKIGVASSGDIGYTSGPYEFSFKDASGKTIFDKGKSLTIWKKQSDGSWKVLYDMFNSDLPCVPNPPSA